jgi:serine/threonine protein kinase/formylglycine-generating enzyme required for sulfatase activity
VDPKKPEHDLTQTQGASPSTPAPEVTAADPVSVEHYTIREVLGRGGFGTVYLAYDETLQREVALKIPHARLVDVPGIAILYLREARAIASLDHPAIIPVYHAASTPTIPCYIVTKRISGCHLGQWAARRPPTMADIAEVMALVSDALAYAHNHGVVHRDIKPSNILIDGAGRPFVADFGLALRDIDPRGGPGYIGTPAYSSPEQVRGEGHRVDGRSDIFSMGVLLYELLTGCRPFTGEERSELFDQILYRDPAPPKQLNPAIPVELARITMQALSKSIGDRYKSADLMALELRAVIEQHGSPSVVGSQHGFDQATIRMDGDSSPQEGQKFQPVVPKGLRAFDVRDADFFMQLLQGPRDREDVPETVRFWKSRIEPVESEAAISVGLIYGPSGCGKTSLVRAAIIPRLSADVTSIYIQATAEDTEQRLTSQIALRSTSECLVDESADVVEAFTTIRRNRRKRTVIFIDQFEQWLFAHPDCVREPLTQALRQCDGEFLQCVLLVRDDFWMGVTRLMQALDLTIAENVNANAVDLFDIRHARNVLAKFGAAYGKLPESIDHLSANQNRFLDAAVEYLAVDGRVICVRLALLTEMLKNRSWENSTGLFDDGGTGIGIRFFEETFESDHASRRTRIHAEAAMRILRALLPESGSKIKGAVRTEAELFETSGYREKAPFREVISILDRELHLITPTDRRSDEDSLTSSAMDAVAMSTGFQLTHDFLVAPIRQWNEYHNRSSKEGKARLRLDEFAELYHVRPRPQSLPSLIEFVNIRRHVRPASWNEGQQKVMRAAENRHKRRLATWLAGILLVVAGIIGIFALVEQQKEKFAARAAVARLLDAKMPEAIELSRSLRTSQYAIQQAATLVRNEDAGIERRVRAALLIANADAQAMELLTRFVETGPVDEVVEIARARDVANVDFGESSLRNWADQGAPRGTLIRAACLIANDPKLVDQLREEKQKRRLVKLLAAENPVWIKRWSEGFRPIATDLVSSLAEILHDETRSESSLNAVNLLTEYAMDDVALLASLLAVARPAELRVLAETLATSGSGNESLDAVRNEWMQQMESNQPQLDVTRPWGSPWWCIGSRIPLAISFQNEISDDVAEKLATYESVVGKQAIVTHKLPISELEFLIEKLSGAGYRLAELVPYDMVDDRFLMVIWLRDGVNSRFIWDATADSFRQTNQQYRQDGFLPDNVTAYRRPGAETVLYSGVWINVPAGTGLVDSDIYIDIPQDLHESHGWGAFLPRRLGLSRSNLDVAKEDGKTYFTSVRWRTEKNIGYHDAWNLPQEEFDSIQRYSLNSTLVSGPASVQSPGQSRQGVTPVWWTDLPIESKVIDYQARREHLRFAKQFLAEGYYPVSMAVSSFGDDPTPQFCSTWWRGRPVVADAIRASKRARNLAIALFLLGDESQVRAALVPQKVNSRFDYQPDALRGSMIAAFRQFDLEPEWLAQRLFNHDEDPGLRRSCAMALALYRQDRISAPVLEAISAALPAHYRQAEPGLRSAIELIAAHSGLSLDSSQDNVPGELQSVAGDRLVMLQPDDPVWLGSTAEEPGRDGTKESLVPAIIDRSFAIATKPVTIAQYLQFQPDHGFAKDYASTTDCPIINVSWFDAARYCRWLSEQEGIPESQMCYPAIDEIKPGMRLESDVINRIGYRLPTETEWEFACRGGTKCSRWFGFDPDRLDEHAWTASNSDYHLQPVGLLLPNDYGLFDMLGNAMDWCHGSYQPYPQTVREPIVDPGKQAWEVLESTVTVQRGGAMLYQPLDARAAQREAHGANSARVYITFRIARTIETE